MSRNHRSPPHAAALLETDGELSPSDSSSNSSTPEVTFLEEVAGTAQPAASTTISPVDVDDIEEDPSGRFTGLRRAPAASRADMSTPVGQPSRAAPSDQRMAFVFDGSPEQQALQPFPSHQLLQLDDIPGSAQLYINDPYDARGRRDATPTIRTPQQMHNCYGGRRPSSAHPGQRLGEVFTSPSDGLHQQPPPLPPSLPPNRSTPGPDSRHKQRPQPIFSGSSAPAASGTPLGSALDPAVFNMSWTTPKMTCRQPAHSDEVAQTLASQTPTAILTASFRGASFADHSNVGNSATTTPHHYQNQPYVRRSSATSTPQQPFPYSTNADEVEQTIQVRDSKCAYDYTPLQVQQVQRSPSPAVLSSHATANRQQLQTPQTESCKAAQHQQQKVMTTSRPPTGKKHVASAARASLSPSSDATAAAAAAIAAAAQDVAMALAYSPSTQPLADHGSASRTTSSIEAPPKLLLGCPAGSAAAGETHDADDEVRDALKLYIDEVHAYVSAALQIDDVHIPRRDMLDPDSDDIVDLRQQVGGDDEKVVEGHCGDDESENSDNSDGEDRAPSADVAAVVLADDVAAAPQGHTANATTTQQLKLTLRLRVVQRIQQRTRQINKGKETPGYKEFVRRVPKEKREFMNRMHPITPRILLRCSKRMFDAQLSCWRKALHDYDTPEVQAAQVADAIAASGDATADGKKKKKRRNNNRHGRNKHTGAVSPVAVVATTAGVATSSAVGNEAALPCQSPATATSYRYNDSMANNQNMRQEASVTKELKKLNRQRAAIAPSSAASTTAAVAAVAAPSLPIPDETPTTGERVDGTATPLSTAHMLMTEVIAFFKQQLADGVCRDRLQLPLALRREQTPPQQLAAAALTHNEHDDGATEPQRFPPRPPSGTALDEAVLPSTPLFSHGGPQSPQCYAATQPLLVKVGTSSRVASPTLKVVQPLHYRSTGGSPPHVLAPAGSHHYHHHAALGAADGAAAPQLFLHGTPLAYPPLHPVPTAANTVRVGGMPSTPSLTGMHPCWSSGSFASPPSTPDTLAQQQLAYYGQGGPMGIPHSPPQLHYAHAAANGTTQQHSQLPAPPPPPHQYRSY